MNYDGHLTEEDMERGWVYMLHHNVRIMVREDNPHYPRLLASGGRVVSAEEWEAADRTREEATNV